MQASNPIKNILLTVNLTLAILWIYQGLVPKILFHAVDEQRLWELQGIGEIRMLFLIQISGYIEIIFGILFIIFKQSKLLHYLNILGMIALSLLILVSDLRYFQQAFNPFVMNVAMAMLSLIALQLLKLQKLHHEK